MLRSYFKIALRNIWKARMASGINIMGLALGMACCFLIIIYVQHEKNHDQFHPDLEQVYRLNYHIDIQGPASYARTPPTIAAKLPEYFPEIEKVARLYPREISARVVGTDQQLEVRNAFFADSTITEILGFDFLYGDPVTALREPFS